MKVNPLQATLFSWKAGWYLLFYFLSLIQCRYRKLTLNEDKGVKGLPVLHNQYHGDWWLGNIWSQGISSNDTDLAYRQILLLVLRVLQANSLTHWGRVTHICVGKLNIIGSDNGLAPRRRQAIIWTNAGILLIRPLGTNFSEIVFRNQTFSFKKMHLKLSSAKWWPFVSASMS